MKNQLHAGRDVGEQAHGQLEAVQKDGVPGGLSGCPLTGDGAGNKQNSEVGEDEGETDAGEVDDVKGLSLLGQHGVSEDVLPQTEDRLVEEAEGLGGQSHKQVGDVWSHAEEPDDSN